MVGANSPWLARIREEANSLVWRTEVLVNVSRMAELMTFSDLAISAAGSTAWERCCLGLPSFVAITAQNQRTGALALQSVGAVSLIKDTSSFIGELAILFQEQAKVAVLQ